ncbi:MAG: M6 family metalloprotease domain-containing protein [Candidatus Aminicenantes bacterium]|nr:M6 family metalloprotease domain-containing protein [Candidatus Aminicenantes bacterium]
MSQRKIIPLMLMTAFSSGLALEPPTRAEIEQYLKDGSFAWRLKNALALGNHLVEPALVENLRLRLEALRTGGDRRPRREAGAAELPSGRKGGLPTKGNVKVFALLIDFPDYPATQTREIIDARLFGDGDIDYPRESLRNYYRRASYDMLEIGGTTLGWYRPSFTRASLPMTTASRESLIREALEAYDRAGHDFSVYDNDKNGVIDYFLVIWTGPDNGWSNFWWGYQTSWSTSSTFQLDGKKLASAKYSWQWESRPYGTSPFRAYVTIHETGHALGLPDYYDYDDAVGPRGGLGGLDMMDAGRGDHNAFSKMLLDWITPQIFNYGTRGQILAASAVSPEALILMPEFRTTRPFDEFFIVQNRHRLLNDSTLPGDGILIWHVDARLNAAGTNFLYNNSYSDYKLIRLMEADGLEEIERGWAADAEDYYLPGREFTPFSRPDSHRYDGTDSGVSALDISPPGASMTFTADIHYSLLPPLAPALRRLESDFLFFREYINRLSWSLEPRNRTEIISFRIYVKPKSGGDGLYTLVAEVPKSALANYTYDHRGLRKDDLFAYRIIAVDQNGVESPAAEVSN